MWHIGIDEAGYGPNLGPLVMTAVACRVVEAGDADLWQVLRSAVRRHGEAGDGRLLIADSKLVYSTTRGLGELEKGVLATVGKNDHAPGTRLGGFLDRICPEGHAELRREVWFTGQTELPVQADAEVIGKSRSRFSESSGEARVVWGLVRSVIVCPARFNDLIEKWDTKAAILALGFAELFRANLDPDDQDDAVSFVIDKHGGRNHYSAMIQHAVPEGMVLAQEEGAGRSAYQVLGLRRPIRVAFEPRADAGHFCVALASMISKYLREVLMLEFNRFWQAHVPGLRASAGYPGDADRFYTAIRPAAQSLGIDDHALWRRK